jgi:succinoglycan biosynthesis protein ExoO
MTARPEVSVIMANYNGGAYLGDAVRSVLTQTLTSLELIIVDDASTDASLAVIEAAAAGDPRVRVIVQPANSGPGAARNVALDQATGRWIAVFDSDDLMAPDRLRHLSDLAEREDARIIADNLLAFWNDEERPPTALLDDRRFAAATWIDLAEFMAASRMHAAKPGPGYLKPLIATNLLAESGARYDVGLRVGEDYDFLVKLLATGARLRFEPDCLYRYRRHEASTSHVLQPEHILAMLRADDDFAKKQALKGPARTAFRSRRRSLVNALAYERTVALIKAGAVASALIQGLTTPSAWPLLTLPLRVRLRRAWRGPTAMKPAPLAAALSVAVGLLAAAPHAIAQTAAPVTLGVYADASDYRIGPQDMLEITVFQVKDLTGPAQVDLRGDVLLPLIGSVRAAGRTPDELSREIAAELGKTFMNDPRVTVSIKDASSQRVTIDGAVVQPGIYPLSGPTTLLQAVALARGPDPRVANLRKVAVFRSVSGQRAATVYDLAKIRSGAAPDPQIFGNDVVVVDTSGARSLLRDLGGPIPFLSIFRPY